MKISASENLWESRNDSPIFFTLCIKPLFLNNTSKMIYFLIYFLKTTCSNLLFSRAFGLQKEGLEKFLCSDKIRVF